MAARMRPTTLKKRHSVSVYARIAVDRERDAAPAHYAREPREVEVIGDAHAYVSHAVEETTTPRRRWRRNNIPRRRAPDHVRSPSTSTAASFFSSGVVDASFFSSGMVDIVQRYAFFNFQP